MKNLDHIDNLEELTSVEEISIEGGNELTAAIWKGIGFVVGGIIEGAIMRERYGGSGYF